MTFGYSSLRRLGEQLGLAKSTVHNHLRAQQRRNQHPESFIWETEAGSEWLARLVFAVLFQFGLKNQIGAGQLSEFFQLIRIDTHVGVSDSSLRQLSKSMETWLVTYQKECEASATAPVSDRVVAMDETFFQRWMVLVLMDLPSGYILLEKTASDRRFETWQAATSARLKALGLTVRHAISDRAKALIKLATQGFECVAGADLFHAQYEFSQWLSLPLARATAQAANHRETARAAFQTQQDMIQSPVLLEPEAAHLARVDLIQAEQDYQDYQDCQTAQQTYRQHQQAISDLVHPFDPATGLTQTASAVKTALATEMAELKTLAALRGIDDKRGRLAAVIKQHDDLSQHVGVWWQWIDALLQTATPEPVLSHWIRYQLMPVVYWHVQWTRTRKKATRQRYQRAWGKAHQTLWLHPFTSQLSAEQLAYWQAWCEDKVPYFQRTSSAVEGRNGGLSQVYHNGRGLTENRLSALTVIHNYAVHRPDGSTPASRLFGQDFPDLFEWLLQEMGPLPLPRKKRKRKKTNSLIYKKCPSLRG